MIIAFVPCRLQSSRLPNKAIQPIYGISAIERCLINTLAIPGIDKVILATSTNNEDDLLMNFSLKGKIEVVRGSADDVLERFIPSIQKYKPDHIVRVTGDCPLVSPELGELTINKHLQKGCDATFTTSKVALGTACEVYKSEAILRLRELIKVTNHSEYLVYYFLNNPTHFTLNVFDAPDQFIKPWRLTLDEKNDLELLNLIYKTLDVGERPVYFSEVETFFERFPETAQINIGNIVKYRDNKELVEFLKKATSL
ncbi:MAG: spore coat protein [Bacteroidia bacterium]|nr:spore coat protein [Bacteroidia bacterium]